MIPASNAVLVSESTTRRFWLGEDPIGKRRRGFDPRLPLFVSKVCRHPSIRRFQ